MKTCWIIYNPVSGRKKFAAHLPLVEQTIATLGYTVTIKPTERPRHAMELVKEACYAHIDMLLISGGDGTVNECVNGLAEARHRPLIAYIPSGTACDIAKTLGISKNVTKALAVIKQNHVVDMDIVKGSHGYFTYVNAIGNYVDISYVTRSKWKRKFGYLAYLFTGVKQFFTIPMIKTEIEHDAGSAKGYYSLIMFVNSRRVAGFNIVRKPVLDDGKIDVVLYRYVPLLNNLLYGISFFLNPKRLPGVTRIQTSQAKVFTEHHRKWNIDGEAADSGNQELRVIPKRLRIIVHPKKATKYFHNQNTGASDA